MQIIIIIITIFLLIMIYSTIFIVETRRYNMNKVSDYINYDRALNKGFSLLNDRKQYRIGFYIVVAVNSGLRVSDLLRLRHIDFQTDKLVITEKKTNKQRTITLNDNIKKGYGKFTSMLNKLGLNYDLNDQVFISQKNTIYNTQSLNVILKQVFNSKNIQVSTHSLRKSFGRKVYENHNENENALVLLSDIFSHASIATTRRYLGIRAETISNVYLTL